MLDVHPPHSPTHTWKDFFIHIATIVVGLLIAVGLEQTVEAIHHHYERHEIEARILEEAARNNVQMDGMLRWIALGRAEARVSLTSLKQAPTLNGIARWTIPNLNATDAPLPLRPSMEAWDSVKTSADITLLPPGEVAVYSRVAFELQQEQMPYKNLNVAYDGLSDFGERVGSAMQPGDTITLSAEERDRLIDLFSTLAGSCDRDIDRWTAFRAANLALLHGASSLEEVDQAMNDTKPYVEPKDLLPKQ